MLETAMHCQGSNASGRASKKRSAGVFPPSTRKTADSPRPIETTSADHGDLDTRRYRREVNMTTTTNDVSTATTGSGDAMVVRSRATELVTPEGKTTIADVVVSKIAGIAAREVPGVHDLVGQGMASAVTGLAQRVTRTDARSTGVNVEVGEREAAVDLRLTVEYGVSIPDLAIAVRGNVMDRLQTMTGLRVKEVNIDVVDLYFPEEDTQPAERRVQ
jgi:uncharacterized alkaline shock family protein YloU